MANRFDVVIFGATGFTGKNTVRELLKLNQQKPVTWAVAGRSESKLKKMLQELKDKTGEESLSSVATIVADIKDEDSLKKMCEQAKVIVNTCGPYRFYGEPVIKACLAAGTHHVDVSGEPQYMEQMQLSYHKAAQDRGIYIVSACGFDSIPCEMGIIDLQNKFDGTVNTVESYLNAKTTGNFSGPSLHFGTWESLIYSLAHASELRDLRRKLYPNPLPEFKPKVKRHPLLYKSSLADNKWVLPFLGSDRTVVARSQRAFYDQEKKRPVQFEPYFAVNSVFIIGIMAVFGFMLGVLTRFKIGRYLLLTYPKIFSGGFVSHEGPSEEKMENTKFSFTFVGKGWSKDKTLAESTDQFTEPPNKTVVTKVSGVNPGYGATCVMLLLTGITILKEADKMPNNGGVYPPGYAFAKTSLVQQLNKNGVTFELISSKEN